MIRQRLGLPAVPEITHQIYYMSLGGAMGKQVNSPIKWTGTDVQHLRSETQLPELTRYYILSQALSKFEQIKVPKHS